MTTRPLVTRALLGAAAVAFALGPFVVPDYDIVGQSISETAAQNTRGAWVARAGFPLLGLAVLTLLPRVRWGRPSAVGYIVFAAGAVAVGVWSHEPYLPGTASDATEAALHSAAATGMGFAVVTAEVCAVWHTRQWRRLVLAGLYLSLPLAMAVNPALTGIYQRVLFAALITHLILASRPTNNPQPAATGVRGAASGRPRPGGGAHRDALPTTAVTSTVVRAAVVARFQGE